MWTPICAGRWYPCFPYQLCLPPPSVYLPWFIVLSLFLSPWNSKLLHYDMQMYGWLCLQQIKVGSHVCIGNCWWGLVWFAVGSFRDDLKLVFLQIAVYLLIPRPWCCSGDSRAVGSIFSCCSVNEALKLKLMTTRKYPKNKQKRRKKTEKRPVCRQDSWKTCCSSANVSFFCAWSVSILGTCLCVFINSLLYDLVHKWTCTSALCQSHLNSHPLVYLLSFWTPVALFKIGGYTIFLLFFFNGFSRWRRWRFVDMTGRNAGNGACVNVIKCWNNWSDSDAAFWGDFNKMCTRLRQQLSSWSVFS